jgi:hypothetical protein
MVIIMISLSRCTYDSVEELDNKYSITFRWIKAYEAEKWADVRTGLIWSFSFLGAELPSGSFDASLKWTSDTKFKCDLSGLGFNVSALESLSVIADMIKASEEYEKNGAIDIGRFLMLTIYSSKHYFKITGVPATLNSFKAMHSFSSTIPFAVTNSGVALSDRLIRINESSSISHLACIASEGNGIIADSSFTEEEYETIDLMSNSQLRFGVYDDDGKLKVSANNLLSVAGKPGKCMWCHESNFSPLFYLNNDVTGYMTSQQFVDTIYSFRSRVEEQREIVSSDVIYTNLQDHTQSELLYISFLEPSAERIANEWGVSVSSVSERMKNLPTHIYPEFPFLGNLYYRSWADSLAPYRTEKVPESAREASVYEPDFFN